MCPGEECKLMMITQRRRRRRGGAFEVCLCVQGTFYSPVKFAGQESSAVGAKQFSPARSRRRSAGEAAIRNESPWGRQTFSPTFIRSDHIGRSQPMEKKCQNCNLSPLCTQFNVKVLPPLVWVNLRLQLEEIFASRRWKMASKNFYYFISRPAVVFALVAMLLSSAWAATERPLYSFTGGNDGGEPASRVTFESSGNVYGPTPVGGVFGCGTVFQLTPMGGGQWQQSVLYSFTGDPDGFGPGGGLVFDRADNLYGTTPDGGAYAEGTIYQLYPNGGGWQEKI